MTGTTSYAGLEKRFVAFLIDGIVFIIISFLIVGISLLELFKNPDNELAMYLVLMLMIWWVYCTVLESSSIGKRVVGIIVINLQGNKISFGKATGRYFAKSIFLLFWIVAVLVAAMAPNTFADDSTSPYLYVFFALLLIGIVVLIIGYLMAGFTPEKQALHDIMARCYVVNGRGQSSSISWKPLVGLAVAVLVSKGIFSQVPKTSSSSSTTSQETGSVTSEKTSTPTPTPTPTPTSGSTLDNLFGELIPPPPSVYSLTNGVRELEFASGLTQHQAILSMNGDSGIMLVRLPNGQGGIQKILQKMTLRQSSKGLVIVGENPIDLDTQKASETYVTDNFFIALSPSEPNKITFRNISVHSDNSKVESPVQDNFLGYPVIGIKMESSSQNTEVRIKEVNKDSPAAKADLRVGDIIRSVNGTTVSNVFDVKSQIISSLLFSTISFEINRDGKNISIEVSPECCVTQEQLNQEQSASPASPASP